VNVVKGTHHHIMDFPALGQLVTLLKDRLEECYASQGQLR